MNKSMVGAKCEAEVDVRPFKSLSMAADFSIVHNSGPDFRSFLTGLGKANDGRTDRFKSFT